MSNYSAHYSKMFRDEMGNPNVMDKMEIIAFHWVIYKMMTNPANLYA